MAAVSLAVTAALAVGGSFAAFYVLRYSSNLTPESTSTRNGWWSVTEPASEYTDDSFFPMLGIPLVVGGVLAAVAALVLVLRRRDSGGPGRMIGMAAAGLLLGAIACIWIELLAMAAAFDQQLPDSSGSGFRHGYEMGAGAWLLLAAAIVALVAIAFLLAPPSRQQAPSPPGWAPPPAWSRYPPQDGRSQYPPSKYPPSQYSPSQYSQQYAPPYAQPLYGMPHQSTSHQSTPQQPTPQQPTPQQPTPQQPTPQQPTPQQAPPQGPWTPTGDRPPGA